VPGAARHEAVTAETRPRNGAGDGLQVEVLPGERMVAPELRLEAAQEGGAAGFIRVLRRIEQEEPVAGRWRVREGQARQPSAAGGAPRPGFSGEEPLPLRTGRLLRGWSYPTVRPPRG